MRLDSLLLLSAYLGRAATQLLLLAAFARAAGPEGAGEFALAFAISTPVVIGSELAFRYVLQTLDDAPGFRVFLALRIAFATFAVSIVALAVLGGLFPARPSILVPLLVMKWADSVLDVLLAQLQSEGRVGVVSSLIWTNTVLSTFVIALVWARGQSPELSLAGSAGCSVVVLASAAPQLVSKHSGSWTTDRRQLSRTLGAGVKLGVAQSLMSLLAYLPIFFLAKGGDERMVGVFAVPQYVISFANLFYVSITQTWVAGLRASFLSGGFALLKLRARTVGIYICAIGLLGGSVTLALLPLGLTPIFGAGFELAVFEVVPFALSIMALAVESSMSIVLIVLNKYTSRVATAGAGLIVAATFGIVILPYASVLLAGYLILIGITTRCLVTGWSLRRALQT